MASNYDATEFIDTDFQTHKSPRASTSMTTPGSQRAPSRDEVDSKVAEAQQKLAELKRVQEELERERSALEELRRRQNEFHTGRDEMIQHLTRGLGLLEEAEFAARRDAEQMAKTVADFREALSKVQAIKEEAWTQDSFNVELTRALTAIENARMEWNSARLKFDVLNGPTQAAQTPAQSQNTSAPLGARSLGELCKMGLALTWLPTLVALLAFIALMVVLLNR
jgi:chromosome segregation ATPase